MVAAYLSQRVNNTKKMVIKAGKITMSGAVGYVTYRGVSFMKDRMIGIGCGFLASYLLYNKLK